LKNTDRQIPIDIYTQSVTKEVEQKIFNKQVTDEVKDTSHMVSYE
jgi:hypothetical protein